MRAVVLATAAAVAVATSWGCTKVGTTSDAGSRHPYTHPHELRLTASEDLVGLNPMVNTQAVLGYLSALTMGYLVKTDASSRATVAELATVVPSLANGGISPDGKTITWHIRQGVKWSDGAPFDGDDVVFSTRLILDPRTNVVSHDGWDQIVRIDEPDKFTVVYHLKAPYASFAYTYFSTGDANPAIVPKHLLTGKDINRDPYNALPVGTGPFRYAEWKRGDSGVLEPNPYYFRGHPKLQRVVYKIVQERNTVLELMRTHEIDLWIPTSAHYVNALKNVAGLKIDMIPGFFYDHLDFNTQRPVGKDPAVRRALRMAIDRKTINDKIRFGVFQLGESFVPPAAKSFHLDIAMTPFDIAGADKVLDRAGWVRGSDGIRAKNGVRLNFDFATATGTPDSDSEIELIRNNWKQLGVDLQVKHYPASLLFATASEGGIIFGGKFDMVVFGYGGNPHQDPANVFGCNRVPPNGQNDSRYCDPVVNAEIERGSVEYDDSKRVAGLKSIQRRIYDDAPVIILDTRREIYTYNDDLKHWQPNPLAPFDDMLNVDI
ncbi:MAG: peptide ABC transporter substrate-binding protein [Candidatus Eremiobacteraeota bacterium]|nr:peptide ABC transporter substrate-binding protein [Candidatus Eremiobacteraeota bacterium]